MTVYKGTKEFSDVESWTDACNKMFDDMKLVGAASAMRILTPGIHEMQCLNIVNTNMGPMANNAIYTLWYNKDERVGYASDAFINSQYEKTIN